MNKKENKENTTNILAEIKETFDLCKTYYLPDQRKMRLLDATDRGELWKALQAKYPKYQILPDTNYISYIKNNILASIYTVAKGASIRPTSEKDKDLVINLNVAIEQVWDLCNVGYYQFQAGERAALLNLGITQVGWDEQLTAGNGDSFYKGNVTLKNISPLKFMMDPFATGLDTAGYCMTYDVLHKSAFLSNPNYKESFAAYEAQQKAATPMDIPESQEARPKGNAKDYYTLLIYWRRVDGKVEEYHTINNEKVLYQNLDIKPSEFPFALLYCNLPAEALVGSSECHKAFANNVAHNLLDSIAITAEYKNQRPPKFISQGSGLNLQSFAKHGDEADKTFVVTGKPDQAVYYHKFPQVSPILTNLKMAMEKGIQLVSGVDGRYTGRDTGSVITTGGVEDMLNRVTLIDTPKIMLYEMYTKQLSKLILANMLQFSPKRKYFVQEPNTTKWKTVEVDFPKIDSDTLFNYNLDISSELPKNKQRIAAMADAIMEKQMQYAQEGSSVQLITEEEWLMFMDLPNKEYMLERMGVQRHQDAVEEVSQTLFGYADLVKQGAAPDDAILAMAKALQDKRSGNMAPPAIPGMVPEDPMQEGVPGMMPQGGAPMMPPI